MNKKRNKYHRYINIWTYEIDMYKRLRRNPRIYSEDKNLNKKPQQTMMHQKLLIKEHFSSKIWPYKKINIRFCTEIQKNMLRMHIFKQTMQQLYQKFLIKKQFSRKSCTYQKIGIRCNTQQTTDYQKPLFIEQFNGKFWKNRINIRKILFRKPEECVQN